MAPSEEVRRAPTASSSAQAFSAPGDSVLIQPPVYAHFHEDAPRNGRRLALYPAWMDCRGLGLDAAALL